MKKSSILFLLAMSVAPQYLVAQEEGDKPGRRQEAGRERGGERGGDRGPEGRNPPPRFGGEGPGGRVPGGPGGPMIDMGMLVGQLTKALPVMKALDADGDGELSVTEIENASKALMRLDKNGDGKLNPEELRPDPADMRPAGGFAEGRPPMGGEMMARMFETQDANKDGKLSGDEIPERLKGMLARVDRDGDGAISKEEITRAAEMMGDRPKGGPGQAPGRRGEGEEGPVRPKRPGN